ncbi:MAG: DUF1127 domain-containing protein [Rhodospirillales bacterium]
MRSQKDNDTKIIRFTGAGNRRIDPETARTLARHARQTEMFGFIRDVVVNGVKAIVRWHRRNVLYRELVALPDSVLADIGLERGQIADVVYRGGTRDARLRDPAAADDAGGSRPGPTEPERPLAA